MRVNLAERHWIFSAAILAVAVPVCALGGLAVALGMAYALDKVGLGDVIPLFPWLWLVGIALAATALWFVARWAARAGGWLASFVAFAAVGVLSVAMWFSADLIGRVDPANSMAGIGGALFAVIFAFFGVVALVCDAVAIQTDPARQPPPLDFEASDE